MRTVTLPFSVGFIEACKHRGLSVKAAAALLWRAKMTRAATPAFMAGVKAACQSTPLPPDLPEVCIEKGATVDRAFIKAAREQIADLDQKSAAAVGPLKTAFERRRNDIQRALNAHVLGEG